jgi:peptidoglycan/xylan/chitin deacetylase (PgdA/CDA1 family)
VIGIARGDTELPARAVAITFDDGSRSVFTHAFPELQRLCIPAAVFVTTDPDSWVFEDQPRLTDDQIRTLQAGNIHIGAHGVTHHGLDQMDDAALRDELSASRETLERLGTEPVLDMALPLNFYNETVLDAAKQAGYRSVFTANPGRIRAGDRLHELRRVAVEGSMTRTEFVANLSARSLTARRIVAYLKRVPPRVLGEERWMPIRRRLFESALGPWLTFRHLKLALMVGVVIWLLALALLALAGSR